MTSRMMLQEIAAPKGFIGGPFGSNLVSKDYADAGVPVIRGSNMGRGGNLDGSFVYVSEDKVARDLSRNIARPGDLVFTQRGTLGQVVLLGGERGDRFVVSQSQMALAVDARAADPRYVYYACTAEDFLSQIDARAIRTGVPHLNLGILKELTIPRMPLKEQIRVSMVLGALDGKISSNATVVSLIEDLRRAMWMQVMRGAQLAQLSSLAQFVNGGAYTKGATGTGRVVIRIAELNNGIGASTVYNDLEVSDRQVAHAGDLLMSWSGSLTAVRWYRDDAIVNQHIFKVIPRDDHPLWAVACAVETKLDEFREIAAGKATTMGHIKRADLDSPVAWPEISDRLNDAGTALWDRALAAEQENLRLAATRDELLPLLMSGKITVKDAEKTVEEVV